MRLHLLSPVLDDVKRNASTGLCVDFLYTLMLIFLPSFRVSSVSKNGRALPFSNSIVNCICDVGYSGTILHVLFSVHRKYHLRISSRLLVYVLLFRELTLLWRRSKLCLGSPRSLVTCVGVSAVLSSNDSSSYSSSWIIYIAFFTGTSVNSNLMSKLTITSDGCRWMFLTNCTKFSEFIMNDDVCPARRLIRVVTYLVSW